MVQIVPDQLGFGISFSQSIPFKAHQVAGGSPYSTYTCSKPDVGLLDLLTSWWFHPLLVKMGIFPK